jgi:uncharacterized protein (DUF1330 family)
LKADSRAFCSGWSSRDVAAAKRWYQLDIYQEAKKLREGAAHLRAVAVQGLD